MIKEEKCTVMFSHIYSNVFPLTNFICRYIYNSKLFWSLDLKKITKAVIPAAGFGTRVLPASKAIPKEMFPVGNKPAIQHLVEEASKSGITDILIITSRGKESIENHFDRSPELEEFLIKKNKMKELDEIRKISNLANIYFIRQEEQQGLGHAVSLSEKFIGDEPFAVLYGDDVILSESPVTSQMISLFYEFKKCVVGVQKVSEEEISKYSTLKTEEIRDRVFKCTDMIEKPSRDQIMSLYSVAGRCILTPNIFKILKKTKIGFGGEIQLTDAMKHIASSETLIAYQFRGNRIDLGA